MTNLFLAAIAVLIAAILSYLGNKGLYKAMGARGLVVGIPVWEETCKALAIWVMPGSPVLFIHLFFGAIDCALSASSGSKSGKALGTISLVTHALTGTLVLAVIAFGQSLWIGYLMAVGLHLSLNAGVVRLLLPRIVWGEN